MSKVKTFDCVEMKNAIQAQMREEFQGLSDAEIRHRIRQELDNSESIVARKWRKILMSRGVKNIRE